MMIAAYNKSYNMNTRLDLVIQRTNQGYILYQSGENCHHFFPCNLSVDQIAPLPLICTGLAKSQHCLVYINGLVGVDVEPGVSKGSAR